MEGSCLLHLKEESSDGQRPVEDESGTAAAEAFRQKERCATQGQLGGTGYPMERQLGVRLFAVQ